MYFGLTNLIQNKIIKVVNDTIKKIRNNELIRRTFFINFIKN